MQGVGSRPWAPLGRACTGGGGPSRALLLGPCGHNPSAAALAPTPLRPAVTQGSLQTPDTHHVPRPVKLEPRLGGHGESHMPLTHPVDKGPRASRASGTLSATEMGQGAALQVSCIPLSPRQTSLSPSQGHMGAARGRLTVELSSAAWEQRGLVARMHDGRPRSGMAVLKTHAQVVYGLK